MFEIESLREAEDLVRGATILGTGGGGDPSEGLELLEEALELRGSVEVVEIGELPESSVIVSPYYVGTIAPTAKTKKPVKIENPMEAAFEKMEEVLGKKIGAVVACEIGGANTPAAMNIGAKVGLPTVNGDLLGRAAPELHQCTVHVFEIPMYPSVIVTETGNVVVVERYADIDDYEALARYASSLAGKVAAVVDTPLSREQAEKALVRGTIGKALELGKAVREAREGGRDPVEAAVEVLGGWKIFEGVVEEYKWRDEGGFLVGEVRLRGSGEWSGRTLRSWIKNEHILAWIDERPAVMPPDLIMFLGEDGEPVTNSELKEGMRVCVLAASAPEVWRTPRGLELFGPRHFGFDLDYVPVEELVARL